MLRPMMYAPAAVIASISAAFSSACSNIHRCRLEILDRPDGVFAQPPPFLQLGSGLVTSAPDLLNFFCAMADGGSRVLTSDSVTVMTTDALNGNQRRQARPILGPGVSWGLATSVDVEMVQPWMAPRRLGMGWSLGYDGAG
jgi:hypothetical protein